jgi:GntR family transcriptional regulator/MocR family aminotransferase
MVKRAGGALLLSVAIDHASPRPVTTQLYLALREMMLAGGIAAGERLPATRTLARELGLSRTTVIEAFDRLTAEGLIEPRVGAGTYVSRALDAERPRPAPAPAATPMRPAPRLARTMTIAVERFGERARLPQVARAFTTALPAFDAFPMAQWARLAARHWRSHRADIMGYGDPYGLPALRRAIAAHLRQNRGIECDAEQVFVVAGAQQAFNLVGSLLLDPGDPVWFENPGAIGARNSLIASGADLVPVPVAAQGLRVDEAQARCPRFRLAFVTPSHQQPLGMTMSLERRFALLKAAERARAWIIEDDYDGEFHFGGAPLPTLKSIDATGLVIYVGTFSKSLFPSLRLGYLVAPPALVDTLRSVAGKLLHGVPTAVQAAVAEFIDEGHFAAHVRRMRRIYAERHDALCAAAARRLGGLLDVVQSHGGLHTVGHLDRALPELAVSKAALVRDITVSPLARYAIAPLDLNGLALGFGGITPPEIDDGVAVLAEVLEDLRRRPSRAAGVR